MTDNIPLCNKVDPQTASIIATLDLIKDIMKIILLCLVVAIICN